MTDMEFDNTLVYVDVEEEHMGDVQEFFTGYWLLNFVYFPYYNGSIFYL